jgi:Mg-chelatase subunit ChlD
MTNTRTPESEALYAQGLEYLHRAQWSEAVQVFSDLRVLSSAYPEVDALLADALLKIEIERAKMPEGVAPPRQRRVFAWTLGIAALALLLAGGVALGALRPAAAQPDPTPRPTDVAVLPTRAPTQTVVPTEAPPSPTAQPSTTPVPTVVAQPGTLTVRMANGQTTTRTIGNIEIILDASGSMLGDIEGRQKIDVAHEALTQLVEKLPETTNIALRTFGHRRTQDCTDAELVAPLAKLDRSAAINQINAIRPAPNSRTPMALSLQQVVEDLKGVQGDKLVVLVSDGDETCDGDPVQVATQLHADNPDLDISVIGFNVGPENWRDRLSSIAQGGGGSYFDAANSTQLVDALEQAVSLSYRVLNDQGTEVYQGALGSSAELPVGQYSVEVKGDVPLDINDIEIGAGLTTTIELKEEGGSLSASLAP